MKRFGHFAIFTPLFCTTMDGEFQRWYLVTDEAYDCFCRSDNVLERWEILKNTSQLRRTYSASQQKVIDELIYRALSFSCEVQFDFRTIDTFLMLLEKEMSWLATASSTCGSNHSTSLQRFQSSVGLSYSSPC